MNTYARSAIAGAAACTLLVAAACQSPRQDTAPRRTLKAAEPMVGRSVQSVLAVARDAHARIEFFTADNTPAEQFPEGASGSVSVHAADGGGQDNYTFNEEGVITRHQRSFGEDYNAGVWTEVP